MTDHDWQHMTPPPALQKSAQVSTPEMVNGVDALFFALARNDPHRLARKAQSLKNERDALFARWEKAVAELAVLKNEKPQSPQPSTERPQRGTAAIYEYVVL